MLLGIDVSHWQGKIHWGKIPSNHYAFCFMKATEGGTYTDPRFRDNWLAIRKDAPNMYRGAYHFARPDSIHPAARQAAHFYEQVGPLGDRDLPPVLDLEKYTDLDPPEVVEWAIEWLQAARKLFDRVPILYMGPNFWRYELGRTERISKYPLWEVNYTRRASPLAMPPWKTWTFWQYTNEGRIQGIEGEVDVNRFNGNHADLERLSRGKAAPVPPRVETGRFAPDWARIGSFTLELGSKRSEVVERIQGLLLSHGYGPPGLVDENGRPDGRYGPATARALEHFQSQRLLPVGPEVSPALWWALLHVESVSVAPSPKV